MLARFKKKSKARFRPYSKVLLPLAWLTVVVISHLIKSDEYWTTAFALGPFSVFHAFGFWGMLTAGVVSLGGLGWLADHLKLWVGDFLFPFACGAGWSVVFVAIPFFRLNWENCATGLTFSFFTAATLLFLRRTETQSTSR